MSPIDALASAGAGTLGFLGERILTGGDGARSYLVGSLAASILTPGIEDVIKNGAPIWHATLRTAFTAGVATEVGLQRYAATDGDFDSALTWASLAAIPAAISSRAIPCFPAGTLVSTPDGPRRIEEILSGDRVWSYDLRHESWRSCMVSNHSSLAYDDLVVTVRSGGAEVRSTYHHPYWVVAGEDLADRPVPDMLDERLVAIEGVPGRWVDAGDLRVGDVLVSRSGGRSTVESVEVEHQPTTVYHIYVEDLHNFAVGDGEWVVHNGHKVTGFTHSGEPRVSAKWRAERGPAAIRRHHLVPQQMLDDPRFISRMQTLGYSPSEIKDFVHRQISDLPNFQHMDVHSAGWNDAWDSWLTANPNFTISGLRSQIKSMMREFGIPRASLGGPRYGG